MSNNKQNTVNRNLLDTQRTGASNQYQDFLKGTGNALDTSRNTGRELSDQIRNMYGNSNNFMPSGMTPNASGWFNLPDVGGGGGDFGAAKSGYQNFANTGGINRGDWDPALGSYKNFINTGGLGESDKEALRARATSMIPSFYDAYKRNAERRSNVQGGYSPGFDAQMAELGRAKAREGFNASRQVEGDILDRVLQGKQFGTSGYGNLASTIAGMEQSGKLAGLGGLKDIAGTEASLGEARAGRNLSAQMGLAEMFQRGGLASAEGLSNLYRSAPGDVGQNMQAWLEAMRGKTGNELGNIGTRTGIKDQSWFDYLPQILGTGSAIAGGFWNPEQKGAQWSR
jgi:hypothetical protein